MEREDGRPIFRRQCLMSLRGEHQVSLFDNGAHKKQLGRAKRETSNSYFFDLTVTATYQEVTWCDLENSNSIRQRRAGEAL